MRNESCLLPCAKWKLPAVGTGDAQFVPKLTNKTLRFTRAQDMLDSGGVAHQQWAQREPKKSTQEYKSTRPGFTYLCAWQVYRRLRDTDGSDRLDKQIFAKQELILNSKGGLVGRVFVPKGSATQNIDMPFWSAAVRNDNV